MTWLTNTESYKITKQPKTCWEEYTTYDVKTETVWGDAVLVSCTIDGVDTTCTTYPNKKETKTYTPNGTVAAGCSEAVEAWVHWGGCVGSRDNKSDEIDLADSNSKVAALPSWLACPSQRIIYLSSNAASFSDGKYTWSTDAEKNLLSALDKLKFSQETYIAPRLLWAWRVLSPEKPVAGWYVQNTSVDTVDKQDNLAVGCGDYDPNTYAANQKTVGFRATGAEKPGCPYGLSEKIIVLMTDGNNTRAPSYDYDPAKD